jgi:4-oxalocrotonate tautomerase family enzyme
MRRKDHGAERGKKMPNASIDGPPIKDLEVKRTLTREITDAMEKAYGIPRQAYVVIINENLPENVCVGGELICDRISRDS